VLVPRRGKHQPSSRIHHRLKPLQQVQRNAGESGISVIWSIERRHFQWPWTRTTLTPSIEVTPFFDAEYFRNGTTYRQFQWNTNRDLHTPYSTASFPMTLSDLEWLSKIFNDTKSRAVSLRERAVSLRQLSFLFSYVLSRWPRTRLALSKTNMANPALNFECMSDSELFTAIKEFEASDVCDIELIVDSNCSGASTVTSRSTV